MPRVAKIAVDPRETAIREEIGGTLAAMRITQNELAKRTGITPSTLSNRMKHIGDMRLSELWAIRDARARSGV